MLDGNGWLDWPRFDAGVRVLGEVQERGILEVDGGMVGRDA